MKYLLMLVWRLSSSFFPFSFSFLFFCLPKLLTRSEMRLSRPLAKKYNLIVYSSAALLLMWVTFFFFFAPGLQIPLCVHQWSSGDCAEMHAALDAKKGVPSPARGNIGQTHHNRKLRAICQIPFLVVSCVCYP